MNFYRIARRSALLARDMLMELRARALGIRVSDRAFLRSLKGFDSIGAFLAHIRTRRKPRFFIAPEEKKSVLDALREMNAERAVLAAAEKTLRHIFDLLGSGEMELDQFADEVGVQGLPWHYDFKSRKGWNPRTFYRRVKRAAYPGGPDIKVPWELSRSQHFAWLGQAYWFTNDERYAQEFMKEVSDWIAQNPPLFGVNWACTMDVAIRAVNWLWGYFFFADSPSLDDGFRLEFFKSLLLHGRHIIANLEGPATAAANHYIADLVGLVYLGIMMPEFKESRQWLDLALRELEKEIQNQVYPDGADFEGSIPYHRLVAEMFLSPIILCLLNNIPLSPRTWSRLEKMIEFVMHYTKPDGTAPMIGDFDNGRLHRLKLWAEPEREWTDHRHLLAIGAVLFEREDFARAAGDQWEEAIWLLGERAISLKRRVETSTLPPFDLSSRSFADAGIYVMRALPDIYLILDAGPNGQNDLGGHAHNDTLSFELYAHGVTFICDPGAYLYTADYRARNRFRSTAYHNTVMVDGEEMNRFEERKLFSLANDALPRVRLWRNTERFDFFDGAHSGYERLADPITHRRQVYLDKAEKLVVIRDLLAGRGEHRFSFHLHFGPLSVISDSRDPCVLHANAANGARLAVVPLVSEGLALEISEGWVSRSYGRKCRAPVATYSWFAEAPTQFTMVLFPLEASKTVEEIRGMARICLGAMDELAASSEPHGA